jgi:ABC-type antimicrobial peptide transport system permease subunit
MAQTSFAMTLLATAAGIALVLGVVGLYGVISYIVTLRTAEIGIRLALGAKPGGVCVMVLRQGLIVTIAGVAVGLVAALALTRLMASLLFEVSAHDPATFVAVALVLTAVSAAATYLPARRAAGIDPVRALRQDG